MKKSQYRSVMGNVLARVTPTWMFVICVLVSVPLNSALAQDATNCVASPSGLIAWWPGDGMASDVTSTNDGTLYNGVGYTTGKVSQAFNLDGSDDYIDIGDLAALDNAGEITVLAWVRKGSAGNLYAGFVGKYDNSPHASYQNTFLLYNGEGSYQNKGSFYVVFEDKDYASVGGATEIPVGTWTFIAGTWRNSDGQMALYKNGELEAMTIKGAGKRLEAHRAYTAKIGEWGVVRDSNHKFHGQIDEVAIFNRALSPTEIAAIYAAGSAGMCYTNNPAPIFVQHPLNETGYVLNAVTLTGAAMGTPRPKYQWLFNGALLANAANATLVLNNLSTNQAGDYKLVASNIFGSVTSSVGHLSVILPHFVTGVESFEDGWSGWTVDNGVWERGVPTYGPPTNALGLRAHEGSNCVATTLGDNYPDSTLDTRLESPMFDVPTAGYNPRLRFWHYYHFYSGDNGSVQIRVVGSNTWETLETYDNYSGYSWVYPSLDLSAYAGKQVQLGFLLHVVNSIPNAYDNAPGWYIDQVGVVTGALPWIDLVRQPANFEMDSNPEFWSRWESSQGIWEVGVPTYGPPTNALGLRAHDGSNCVATTLGDNYPDSTLDTRLESPMFDVPTAGYNPRLRFWHYYHFYSGDNGSVQIRVVGSNTWQTLATYSNYSGYSWVYPSLDLSAYAGKQVQLGFLLHVVNSIPNAYDNAPGWYIDQVGVVTGALPWIDLVRQPANFEMDSNPEFWSRWESSQGIWEVGVPTYGPATNALGLRAHEGSNCVATTLGDNYPDSTLDTRLESPMFDVPTAGYNPRLRFWHYYHFYSGDNGSVQIRVVGSNTWETLETYDNYSGYSWVYPSLDLSAYAGKQVQLGFLLHVVNSIPNAYDNAPGWYIDQVGVVTGALPWIDLVRQPANFEMDSNPEFWSRWESSQGIWEVGVPTYGPPTNALGLRAHDGSNCVATTLGDNYPDSTLDTRLESPMFDVPTAGYNPRLRFWHYYHFYSGDNGSVQIRVVGSNTWETLETYDNYSGYSWVYPSLDLSAYAGKQVQLGFLLHVVNSIPNAYDNAPGWYIDQVGVVTGALPWIDLVRQSANFEMDSNPEFWSRWESSQGIWEVGVPTYGPPTNALGLRAHDGSNCVATTLGDNYPDSTLDTRLESPMFDVPTAGYNPRLRFWHYYHFYSGDNGSVQIRVVGSNTWETLETYDNYSGYSWVYPSLDLSAYAGKQVQLGFLLHVVNSIPNAYDNAPGWYIDQVGVVTGALPWIDLVRQSANFEMDSNPEFWSRWESSQGIWEVGVPTYGPPTNALGLRAHDGSNCVATTLGDNYPDSTLDTRLESPMFDVPTAGYNPRLRFWHYYHFYSGDNGSVQIRVVGSNTWETLETYDNYSGYSWVYPSLDLSAYAGKQVQLGFLLHVVNSIPNAYDNAPGWYIDEIQVVTNTIVFNNPESFESGWGDWSSDFGVWEIGHPTNGLTCGTGTNWAATILNGNYPDNYSSHLISPAFIVPCSSAQPRLRFWHWWNFGSSDWGQVQVRTNNGTWIALSPQYSGSSGCTLHILDLSAYAGQTIQIGFYFESHSPNTADGWHIGDVFIQCNANALQLPSLPSSVNESAPWTFTCTAVCADLVFGLKSGAPSGAAIEPETGAFSWTPYETQGPGVYSITVWVTNRMNSLMPVDSETFSVTVNEVNERPVLTNVITQVANELASWSYQLYATDPDIPTNPLTFSLVSGPAGMAMSSSGYMSWTPSEDQGSNHYTVTVRVTDTNADAVNEHQLSDTRSFTFTVNEVNSAPGLDTIANRAIDEGTTLWVTNRAWDSDIPANPLTFSLVSPPAGMTISNSGVLVWIPSEAQGPGNYTVTVKVTDYNADAINEKQLSATQTFNIVVYETNSPPVWSNIPAQTIDELALWSYPLTASDPDIPANPLTFGLISGPSGLSTGSSGVLNWTPSELQGPGNYTVTVKVTDYNANATNEQRCSATQAFAVVVRETNSAPRLDPIANYFVYPGQTVAFYAVASDADWPTNTITFSGTPWIDPITGFFSWTATNKAIGETTGFTIRVTDNGTPALDDSQAFEAQVGTRLNIFADSQTCKVFWSSISGLCFEVEYKDNLPVGIWSNLCVVTTDTNNPTKAFDPAATNMARRYYRVRPAEVSIQTER